MNVQYDCVSRGISVPHYECLRVFVPRGHPCGLEHMPGRAEVMGLSRIRIGEYTAADHDTGMSEQCREAVLEHDSMNQNTTSQSHSTPKIRD